MRRIFSGLFLGLFVAAVVSACNSSSTAPELPAVRSSITAPLDTATVQSTGGAGTIEQPADSTARGGGQMIGGGN